MNVRKLQRFIHCAMLLLVLGIALGIAGCSKKAIKTASPDAIAADMEQAVVDGLTNASSSEPVTEAFGTVPTSRGMVDDKGKVGELEIEIMDSDLGSVSGSASGRSTEVAENALGFGPGGGRGASSRAGEEFVVVQPGAGEGAQTPSGTLSLITPGQLVPGGRGSGDERVFIEGTSSGKAATDAGRSSASGGAGGGVSRGLGADGETIVIESARAGDTHATGGTERQSIEGERQSLVRPRTKESTTTFLVEESATGNIVNFSDAPETDASGSAEGARASSSGEDEMLVIIPRSTDEGSPSSEGVGSAGRQTRTSEDIRHADSGTGAEHVPEPLIFAKVQPELMVPSRARDTEPQAPSVASAPADTFFIQEDLENIYFDYDRWAIPQPMQARLSDHAQWLKAHPGSAVLIEGHCDVRGSREYNMVLGEKRARSVKGFLLDLGVKEDQLSLISYGKERLTCFESREACHGDNRRAQFVMR